MSECVVRMEMPEGCWDCPFVNGEYGYCQADKEERQIEDPNERPSWCPIIAASPWHRVELEEPTKAGWYLVMDVDGDFNVDEWHNTFGWQFVTPSDADRITHWMPIEPPKEDA